MNKTLRLHNGVISPFLGRLFAVYILQYLTSLGCNDNVSLQEDFRQLLLFRTELGSLLAFKISWLKKNVKA